MTIMNAIVSTLLIMIIVGYAIYPAMAQPEGSSLRLQFMTMQKLVQNTDASLLLYTVDAKGSPLPVRLPVVSVTSSDPSVVEIKNVSLGEFDNTLKVDVYAGKPGASTITVVAKGFQTSTITVEVVRDAYKPNGLVIKATPSSFAYYGPFKGYLSVQLVNFYGDPVLADEDTMISLSSSDTSVVSLNKHIVIKKGENFAIEEFTVAGSGSAMVEGEVPGKWKQSVKITMSEPKAPLGLKLYALPQTAPAALGQTMYGLVQLQSADGVPVKAERDIPVNVISQSADMRGGTGIIKRGGTTAVITLSINSNSTKTVELTALAKGFKPESVSVQLAAPLTRINLNPDTRFDDPEIAIDPNILSIPILADGTEQILGVAQLLSGTSPVVPFLDVPIFIDSSDGLMEIKQTVIPKGSSSALIKAKVGYQAGTTEVGAVAEYYGKTLKQITLLGHGSISLATEPLISKVMDNMSFPYIVYFRDSQGMAAYSPEDMTLSITKTDTPKVDTDDEITDEILHIGSGTIRRGSMGTLLEAQSKESGTSALTIEGRIRDVVYSATSTVLIDSRLPEKLELFIPSPILGNAKYSVPLRVLDRDGLPIKAMNDLTVTLVPSIRNVISAPESILLPKDKYFTTFMIQTNETGMTDITAHVQSFDPTALHVEIVTVEPSLTLTPSAQVATINKAFSVTLNATYGGMPVRDLHLKWSSDKATLLEGVESINETDSAEAKFMIHEPGQFAIEAEASGTGLRTTKTAINIQTESLIEPRAILQNVTQTLHMEQQSMESRDKGILDMLLSGPYLLILPAIGGAVFWFVRSDKMKGIVKKK